MKPLSVSEKAVLLEVSQAAHQLHVAMRGLSCGALIKLVRRGLGMSQEELAKRAGVPQSMISKVEREAHEISEGTLRKILPALSCDLLIVPYLTTPLETLRQRQAEKLAKKRVKYLLGTMELEGQAPDALFIEELYREELNQILGNSRANLWDD